MQHNDENLIIEGMRTRRPPGAYSRMNTRGLDMNVAVCDLEPIETENELNLQRMAQRLATRIRVNRDFGN
jgi:hypothetical protein